MQHVITAKGQCETVDCPRKKVKGKRIGAKRNSLSTKLYFMILLLFDLRSNLQRCKYQIETMME